MNLDVITNENNAKHNLKWPYILDHPHGILIMAGSGSRKTDTLLNLIREQDNDELIDKTYLHTKDLNEPKYQLLIKKCEDIGIKHLNNPKACIKHLNTLDDIYGNINHCNPERTRKIVCIWWNDCWY